MCFKRSVLQMILTIYNNIMPESNTDAVESRLLPISSHENKHKKPRRPQTWNDALHKWPFKYLQSETLYTLDKLLHVAPQFNTLKRWIYSYNKLASVLCSLNLFCYCFPNNRSWCTKDNSHRFLQIMYAQQLCRFGCVGFCFQFTIKRATV